MVMSTVTVVISSYIHIMLEILVNKTHQCDIALEGEKPAQTPNSPFF
jgi:hypothetical protein